MKKKELYSRPSSELLELNYAEPVCQAASGSGDVPDYDPITNPGFNIPDFPSLL